MIIFEAYEGFVHGGDSHSENSYGNGNDTTQVPHFDTGHHIQKRASSCKYAVLFNLKEIKQ